MQIVCPACAAAYEVPITLLKPGQAVRCARCAQEWVPSLVGPETAMAGAEQAHPGDVPALDAEIPLGTFHPQAGRPNIALRLAWAASVAAVLALGWGAYAGRATVMQTWPPSIRLYAAMGLAADR